jgi:hypothetical protein
MKKYDLLIGSPLTTLVARIVFQEGRFDLRFFEPVLKFSFAYDTSGEKNMHISNEVIRLKDQERTLLFTRFWQMGKKYNC